MTDLIGTIIVVPPTIPNIKVAPPDTTSIVVPIGGPPGPAGPPGANGTDGLGAGYEHIQSTPAATWTVEHNLGAYPNVVLMLDSEPGVRVYTDISYPDENTAVVLWPEPVTGKAYVR